ncbi:MAG: hypothetical protein OYM47_18265 [Gemmatimonadota bacterium]|nr:hypothetical protein [Gemmatimonadota bacterium]
MNFTLGLPNGSMQGPLCDLLSRIGLDVRPTGRNGQVSVGGLGPFSQAVYMRPQDIPTALLKQQIDCGICGLDCVVETELAQPGDCDTRILRLQELRFSRDTRDPARVVLFGRPDSPLLSQDATVSISSEYPAITRDRYPNADIGFSHGSTEIKVAMKLFDYGVGVTITGISLRENGLEIADEFMVSPIVVIARNRTPEFVALGDLMAGALEAENQQLIKLNVDNLQRIAVLEALPARRAPTLSRLSDCASAIEAVVPRSQTAGLLIRLRTLGATDIVVQDINAIVG